MKNRICLVVTLLIISFIGVAQNPLNCNGIETLPYTEDFENYANFSLPDCWTRVVSWSNTSGRVYPDIYNNANNAHQGTGYLYFYGGNNFIALPRIDQMVNSLRVTFWMKPASPLSTYGSMEIGVMSDLSDNSSFQLVQSWTADGINSTQWQKYVVDLTDVVPTDTDYIVFRRFVNSTNGWYLDDVTVELVPLCDAPEQLTFHGSTATSALLSWNPGENTVFNVYYKPVQDSAYDVVAGVSLGSDSLYTLSNLIPGTQYECYVASVCSDGTETFGDPVLFNTLMVAVDIPYTTDFGGGSDQNWVVDNGGCVNRWVMGQVPGDTVSALYVSTDGSTSGYNITSQSVVSASKLFTVGEEPLILVSFDVMSGGESYFDYLKLFVAPEDMTFPATSLSVTNSIHYAHANYSTHAYDFTNYMNQSGGSSNYPFKYNLTNGSMVHIDAVMPNPNPNPDASSTAQVVFLWRNDSGVGTQPGALITNLTVSTPTCPQPDSVTVSNVTPFSADLAWNGGDATSWTVEYGPQGFTPGSGTVVNVSGNPAVTLTGLSDHAAYDVYVRAVCEVSASAVTAFAFSTSCLPLTTVPQTWGFDSDLTDGTAVFPYPGCWSRLVTGTANQYPYANEYPYHAHSFPYALHFDNYYPYAYAVMPAIDPDSLSIDTLQVTFFAHATASDIYTALEVGVMSDPADTSTFTLVRSFYLPTSYYENPYRVMFNNFTGEGNYIAFRNAAYHQASNEFYLDDVTLSRMPSCCTAQQMAAVPGVHEANLTWAGAAGTFDLYYKLASDPHDYNYVVVHDVTLTDGYYTLSGLTPGTVYNWYLVSNCDSSTAYTSSVGTFSTLCEGINELPMTWDFESGLTAGTTENPLPYCWRGVGSGNGIYPYTFSSNIYTHSGSHTLFYYNLYPNSFGIMPNIDEAYYSMNNLQVSFYARLSAVMGDARIVVGVMDNPTDTASFVPMDTILLTDAYPTDPYIVTFEEYDGDGTYVAFKNITSGSLTNYTYIDDVTLLERPACTAPTGLASFPSSNTVNLRWDDMTEGYYHVYYKADTESVYSADMNVLLLDTSYTISNLSPATDYSYYIVRVCPEGSESASEVRTFTTLCVPEVAPYAENFSGSMLPECWERRIGWASEAFAGTALQPTGYGWGFASTNGFSTLHATLRIYGTNTKYWLISPEIDLDTLTHPVLTFQLALTDYAINAPIEHPDAQQDDKFMVVISTDHGETWSEANATVWSNAAGADYAYNQISFQGEEVLIPLEQYVGENIRIAFYGESTAAGDDNDLHIANVAVQQATYCPAPTPVVLTDLADVTATLTWTENGTATTWKVEYGATGFEPGTGTIITVIDTPSVTLSGLDESTSYDVYVQAVCGANAYSNATFKTFTTSCAPITLPYFQNFDSIPSGLNGGFAPCWRRINNYSGYQYPYISEEYVHGGSGSLYFYCTTSTYCAAVLPMIDADANPVNTLQISFYMRSNYTSSKLLVGVMTNPLDINTFETVDTVYVSGNGIFGYQEVPLDSYTGSGRYVALRLLNTTNNAPIYVDDVKLEVIPACEKPMNVNVTNVTDNSALVWWLETGDATSWNVKVDNGDAESITMANATSLMLTNLTASTTYTVSVQAICDTDNVSEWSEAVTFITDTTIAPEPCEPPTGLLVTDMGTDHVVLTWNDQPGAVGWNIQYRKQGENVWMDATSNTNTFTISNLAEGVSYEVRLQAVCADTIASEWSATMTFTTNTGIEDYLFNSIALYPNPAKEYVDVHVNDYSLRIQRIELLDVFGKILTTAEVVENPMRLQVSGLADGMYFIRLQTNHGFVTKVFLKKG